jgi:hypothetical protein
MWGLPAFALLALLALTLGQYSSRDTSGAGAPALGGAPFAGGGMPAPDISSMSPAERADRLFNRVMRLWSEGKADSAAFFGPMALGALEALAPFDLHRRYDYGLIALVTGNVPAARAHADTILAARRTHLLGLMLAARAADARGDTAAAADFRRQLVSAEKAERAAGLQEYTDHDADISDAISRAR